MFLKEYKVDNITFIKKSFLSLKTINSRNTKLKFCTM